MKHVLPSLPSLLPLPPCQAATLGSQEGAFENVRLNFSENQGPMMRQLLANHSIIRVAMCALTSVKGRRQHLCVNHDKGKLTILQLFPILKQADSNRRKLTLTVSGPMWGQEGGGGGVVCVRACTCMRLLVCWPCYNSYAFISTSLFSI